MVRGAKTVLAGLRVAKGSEAGGGDKGFSRLGAAGECTT